MEDEAAIQQAFRQAAESLFEIFETALASRSAIDWLGGLAIASEPVFDSPALDSCVEAISHTHYIAALGGTGDGPFYIATNDGNMTPASARGVAHNVLTYAAARLFWSGAVSEQGAYVDAVTAVLGEVLRWLDDDSETVEGTEVIALYNVYIPEGLSIQLPFGTLRPAPHNPRMPELHQVGGLIVQVELTDWDDAPSAILVRRRRVRAKVVEAQPNSWPPGQPAEPAQVAAESVALAIVLACGHHDHSAPTFAGQASSDPLTGGLGTSSRPRDYQRAPGIPVPESVISELEKYASSIAKTDPASSLMFAGRRLLRSLNSDSPEDSLVDAVVVWESIFSASPETAFRVTASVASTLRNDFDDHLPLIEFQKILNDIYEARSQIVHGDAAKVKKRSAKHYDDARNARRYSRRLLRHAFLWPKKVREQDSGTRSKQAILGEWPPSESLDDDAPEE